MEWHDGCWLQPTSEGDARHTDGQCGNDPHATVRMDDDERRPAPVLFPPPVHPRPRKAPMDADRSHEIVAYVYLTADKGLFVNPQYPIYIVGKRHLPDFVAAEPAVQRVWLVEVSRNKSLRDLRVKCQQYATNLPDVRAALAPAGLADWRIGLWLILRADTILQAAGLGEALNGLALRTTAIEEAVASWMWLNTDGITRTP